MFKAIVFSKNIITFVVSLVIYFCINNAMYSQSVVTQTGVTRVVVDAGHGGLDSGSVGKNSKEKNINLAVALLVGKMISDSFPSVEVIYTRKTDAYVALDERAKLANKHNADLFISIHSNSVGKNKAIAKGSETFVMGITSSAANMEVAKRENAVITYEADYSSKYEGYDPNSPESFIIFSLMQNAYLEQSMRLALLVQSELGNHPIKVNRGVKQAGFLVLYLTAMPSILIELGFISNAEDEKILISKEGQAQIANAIFRAFKDYKIYYDKLSQLANNAIISKTAESEIPKAEPKQESEAPRVEPEKIAPTETPTTKPITQPTTKPATKPTTASQKKTTVTYRVQIKASKTKIALNAKEFQSFKDVRMIFTDGYYKYMTGDFATAEEARRYCTQVVRKKVKDAFIICVENEKIVPLKK